MHLHIGFLVFDAVVAGIQKKKSQFHKLKCSYPVLQVQQLALREKIPVVSGLWFEKSQALFTDD